MVSIKHILVPTDFSQQGKTALMYAVAFADQFAASLELLHVVEQVPPGALMSYIALEDLKNSMRQDAEKKMDELHSEWEDFAFPVTKTIVDGHAVTEIIKHAKEIDADIIIMGTHGRSAIAHMLLGSVAENVVRQAPCPVLTVHHPEHEFVHPAEGSGA